MGQHLSSADIIAGVLRICGVTGLLVEKVLRSLLLKSVGKDFVYKLFNGTGFVAGYFFNIICSEIAPALGISFCIIVHHLLLHHSR